MLAEMAAGTGNGGVGWGVGGGLLCFCVQAAKGPIEGANWVVSPGWEKQSLAIPVPEALKK